MGMKYRPTIKDIVIVVVFLIFLLISVISYFCSNGFENIGAVFEQTLIITLSFITLVDIASYVNWSIFVPDFFEAAKEQKRKRETFLNFLGYAWLLI